MRSFLRWAGSKRQQLPKLRQYWRGDLHATYIEPFAGSACLFFDLQPQKAVLGDLNWELINSFRAVQRNPRKVLTELRKLRTGKRNYYRIRGIDPRELSQFQIAARFIYLNWYCFNGLYRTNLKGQFNVPYGPPKDGTAINSEKIVSASHALRNASLLHADFEETVSQVRRGDFVYMDPPYFVSRRKVFAEYGPKAFGSVDLGRLQEILRMIDRRGATFLITYADSAEARDLLNAWKPKRIRTRRNIAGFALSRRHSFELMATNLRY